MTTHRVRFILLISSLLIMGFLGTNLASFFVSREAIRKQIQSRELPLTSNDIYADIQRDIIQTVMVSSFMASDTFLRDWVLDGETDPAKIYTYLKTIQEKYGTVTAFFVSEKTRRYYHADGLLKEVKPDEPRDAWYFRIRDMVSDYEINFDPDLANDDTMTVFVNYRVYGHEKNFIGAAGIGLGMPTVMGLLDTYEKKYQRNIYFTDMDGTVVLHSLPCGQEVGNIRDIRPFPMSTQQFLQSRDSVASKAPDGSTVFLHARLIPELGWYLIVEQDDSEAVRPIRQALMRNLLISLAVTVILAVLIYFLIGAYQRKLLGQQTQLEEARDEIHQLTGLLPICASCKKIRDEQGKWHAVEAYVSEHSDAAFSHGICPECIAKDYSEFATSTEAPNPSEPN
jgi:hypothetical protein